MNVPFLGLAPSHAPLKAAILEEISSLIDSGAFTNGSQVAAFEKAFAEFCGARYCVGTASGLDALRLALIGAGDEPSDEAILPANTFAATIEALVQVGVKPVLADISESDYSLDPTSVKAAIGRHTRFLLPVHLYG